MRSNFGRILGILLLGGLLAASAQAQPFSAWAHFSGPTHGYIEIASSSDLNSTAAFTVEAWVSISNGTTGEDCRSIAGKGYTQAWWIGQCNVSGQPTLRSYLGGHGSKNGGIIPRGVWTHVAVTYDGVARRHYINGELAATFAGGRRAEHQHQRDADRQRRELAVQLRRARSTRCACGAWRAACRRSAPI